MLNRDKSFTVNITPHDATKKRKEWIISGKRLLVFRMVAGFMILVVIASVVIVYLGPSKYNKVAELTEKNTLLEDSLVAARELNNRLDLIEFELQEIRNTRSVIENLARAGVSGDNPE